MSEEETESKGPYSRLLIPIACILSGLALTPLLPIGYLLPISHPYFLNTFFVHLGLQTLAILIVLLFFIELCSKTSWGTSLSILLVLLLIVVEIFLGSVPVTSRDALIHHLAVPKWWIRDDRILTYQWHDWSYYPMLINLGFTGLMKLGLTQFTPLYHYTYLILLAGVVASFCFSVTRNHDYSFFAFLVTMTIPMCIRLGSEPIVDLGLALYMTIAFVLVYIWAEEKRGLWMILLAGIGLGLAMSCKYNGLLAMGIFCSLLFIPSLRSGRGVVTSLIVCVLCGTVAMFVLSPWMLRNLPTGNPFYPLFHGIFGTGVPGPEGIRGVKPIEKLSLLYGEKWWEILLLPIRMLLYGQDHNPRLFDGQLTPILIFMFLPLIFERKRPWVWFSFLFCLAYCGLTICFAGARIRYLAPIYGTLVILTVLGLWSLAERVRPRFRYFVLIAVGAFHLTIVTAYTVSYVKGVGVVDYVGGKISREEYLTERIPEYEMIQYMNTNLPDDSLTYLLLTGNRFYYYDKDILSGGYHSANDIIKFIKLASQLLDRDPSEYLAQEFLHRKIDYLMLHNNRTIRTLNEILNNQEKATWNAFESHFLDLIHENNGYSLWRIRSLEERAENTAKEQSAMEIEKQLQEATTENGQEDISNISQAKPDSERL